MIGLTTFESLVPLHFTELEQSQNTYTPSIHTIKERKPNRQNTHHRILLPLLEHGKA